MAKRARTRSPLAKKRTKAVLALFAVAAVWLSSCVNHNNGGNSGAHSGSGMDMGMSTGLDKNFRNLADKRLSRSGSRSWPLSLSSFAAAAAATSSEIMILVPSQSLLQPYTEDELHLWEKGGKTTTRTDVFPNFMSLTRDVQGQSGWMRNLMPAIGIGQEWEAEVQFRVSGSAPEYFGDGFAIWYTSDPTHTDGKVLGSKDYWEGLGIFFDTFDNGDVQDQHYPFVRAYINDGSKSYINREHGMPHGGSHICHSAFRQSMSHDGSGSTHVYPSTARIKYSGKHQLLTVDLLLPHLDKGKHEEDMKWRRCVEMTDVHLPSGYYWGFSATTGDLTDRHEILEFRMSTQMEEDAIGYASLHEVWQHEEEADFHHAAQDAKRQMDAQRQAEEDLPTEEEMEGINNIVADTEVVKQVKEEQARQLQSIADMKSALREEVKAVDSTINEMVMKLKEQEDDIGLRIQQIERALGIQIDEIGNHVEKAKKGYRLPFVILICSFLALVFYAWRRYQQIKRTHIL